VSSTELHPALEVSNPALAGPRRINQNLDNEDILYQITFNIQAQTSISVYIFNTDIEE
jgi:hypothetical protein